MVMANIETRHNEYTFLGSGYSIQTHLLRAAARLRVYFIEIWARGGSTTTAGGDRRASSKEKRATHDLHGERPSIIIRSGKGWECSGLACRACRVPVEPVEADSMRRRVELLSRAVEGCRVSMSIINTRNVSRDNFFFFFPDTLTGNDNDTHNHNHKIIKRERRNRCVARAL